jgi:hypothetical protein
MSNYSIIEKGYTVAYFLFEAIKEHSKSKKVVRFGHHFSFGKDSSTGLYVSRMELSFTEKVANKVELKCIMEGDFEITSEADTIFSLHIYTCMKLVSEEMGNLLNSIGFIQNVNTDLGPIDNYLTELPLVLEQRHN